MVNLSKKQLSLLAALALTAKAVPTIDTRTTHGATQSEYDIIVVGGGAGGLVASTKFAESGLKTLLLEHGGPMLYVDGNREIPDWTLEEYSGNNLTRHDAMMYYATNYPGTSPNAGSYYCTNLVNLAACMLGGGTSVNAAQQWWPPRKYLDNAFENIKGWTGNVFQEAIQRVAARIPPTATWSSDNKHYYDQVYYLMGSVLESIGITEVDSLTDVDDKYNTYGRDVFAAIGGQRGGPLVGYLQDAKKLPNFTLKMYSPVTSVIRNGSKITGVEVNGTVITAKTVVLSAGVWNTPSILFASGIGPVSELSFAKKIGFTKYEENDWIINDGVGANLHDNPQTTVNIQYSNSSELPFYGLSGVLTGNVSKTDADDLYHHRAGPLSGPGRLLTGWINVPYPNDTSKYMTVQTICSRPTAVNGSFVCQFNLNEGLLSRGRVALGTGGNLVFSDGVGPWLTNSLDTELYATALKRFVDGVNAYPGLNVTTPAGTHDLPYYISYLNETARVSNNHWGGSCSLGLCVDEDALVYGTDNLFVIDGSLSPAPTTSNPAFLYEAIAELASEKVIKKLGS
ncbi:cellobiose dehydrogenase [Sclerotinia borealis F-4128]|uniref:Cellobiose dehydrogenase n=1 Tax=Sclerotinia borealis (strain F-4128) TaxID=1432307 RepID=W9C9E0_SCLBF|nr:cellobiose dehydrogenase [Sclerotinia borealis F-4128]